MLHARIRHELDRITLDVTFDAGDGLTALVGPSGSGKTTTLNVIAGFLQPDHALIRIGDDVLVDTEAGRWVPPYRRRIGYVFQEPRLFPHLSVRHNLTYGRWFGRVDASPVAFEAVVALLDLEALLARKPARLSGGEKQRVALGRALLASPRLLLLDEPLASVDVARRQEVLPYLDRLRLELGLPVIYVTHAWSEIETRAERIVALDEGRVVTEAPGAAAAGDRRPAAAEG